MFKLKTFILFSIPLIATGCIRISTSPGVDGGGVYKSVDSGDTWEQKVQLLRLPEEINVLSDTNITAMVFDPQDSNTLYLGTQKNGAFVSFDAARTWERIRNLDQGAINAISVDPLAKHIVYIAVDNSIFKTVDANRNWELIYIDGMDGVEMSALIIDSLDSHRIYAGLSDGRIIKSEDNGMSWQFFYDTRDRVIQIAISPFDNQTLYIVSNNQGIFQSNDVGTTWKLINNGLQGATALAFDVNTENTLISLSSQGLFRSENGGESWKEYTLLIPGSRLKVYTVALDPQDSDILYYSTATTLYRSVDGGENWIIRSLPFNNKPKALLVDPLNSNILYIGVGE
ncbi:YCF48-related protein [Patescibacteria group bacterium AH-259-L07]|nr:YCF48-related protein [Patescibacteria group bacterium AH-259-L07]